MFAIQKRNLKMSTDDVLLLLWGAHFYIDKVCATFPFIYQHNTGRYRNALLFTQNARRYQRALPFKQNAEKVPETKKEGRRRTTATSRPPDESIWCLILYNQQNAEKVSETKREGRRRTTAMSRPPDESIWCLILYNQQNAEKVSETKREGRRRTIATPRPSRWSIWCLIRVLKRVLNEFGSTVLLYSPQSPPASHCLYRFRWAW